MMRNKNIKVILSGGGTGGHLFPAIAIANEIKNRYPNSEILFVGALGKMEMEKVPEAGYKIEGLWIGGFQRSHLIKNLNLPFKIISSLRKSKKILKSFKPDVVIGTGGYASFPLLYKASKRKIPSLIQEQNYFPGVTNKYLSKYAQTICTAFSGMEKYFPKEKIVITGNPVRENIKLEKSREFYKEFGLNPDKKTLLVIGGSLGARTINNAMKKHLDFIQSNDIQVIWQTGKYYFEQLKVELETKLGSGILLAPFIKEMGKAYAIADVVISRAGAISLSELSLVGKASILIPSPNVAEDHQTKNALKLVDEKAAILVKDYEAELLLGNSVIDLFKNEILIKELEENILKLSKPEATKTIVNEIEKLINQ